MSDNPILRKLMERGTQAFDTGKMMKSPFANLVCPDGEYYVQLKRAELGEVGKVGNKQGCVRFRYVILCHAGDNTTRPGDRQFAGEQPQTNYTFRGTERRTEADAWANFFDDLQTLGYDTTLMVMHESMITDPSKQFTLPALLQHLTKEQPFLRVRISTDGQYRNTNLVGVVSETDLTNLLGADPRNLSSQIELKEDVPDQASYDYGAEQAPMNQQPAPAAPAAAGQAGYYIDPATGQPVQFAQQPQQAPAPAAYNPTPNAGVYPPQMPPQQQPQQAPPFDPNGQAPPAGYYQPQQAMQQPMQQPQQPQQQPAAYYQPQQPAQAPQPMQMQRPPVMPPAQQMPMMPPPNMAPPQQQMQAPPPVAGPPVHRNPPPLPPR